MPDLNKRFTLNGQTIKAVHIEAINISNQDVINLVNVVKEGSFMTKHPNKEDKIHTLVLGTCPSSGLVYQEDNERSIIPHRLLIIEMSSANVIY